jgi:hypothetical protein
MCASTFRTALIPQQIPVRSTLFYGCRCGSAALLQIALAAQRAALSGADAAGTATARHKEKPRLEHIRTAPPCLRGTPNESVQFFRFHSKRDPASGRAPPPSPTVPAQHVPSRDPDRDRAVRSERQTPQFVSRAAAKAPRSAQRRHLVGWQRARAAGTGSADVVTCFRPHESSNRRAARSVTSRLRVRHRSRADSQCPAP